MKKILGISLLLSLCNIVLAQHKESKKITFFNRTNISFHTGLYFEELITGKNENGDLLSASFYESNQSGLSVRNEAGIKYNNTLSVGIGVGLENFNVANRNTTTYSFLPIYGDVRYSFNKKKYNSFFVGASYGYSIRINNRSQNGGGTFNPKIGYRFLVNPKIKMAGFLGYLQQSINVNNPENYLQTPKLRSLNFGVGIEL